MNYYKIYENGIVVDVNHLFFRVQTKFNRIIPCEPQYAQLIKASKEEKYYTTNWLLPLIKPMPCATPIEAVEIDEEEYNRLRAQLDQNEVILPAVPEIEPVVEKTDVVEKEPERVISMKELFDRIQSLEAELNDLKKK